MVSVFVSSTIEELETEREMVEETLVSLGFARDKIVRWEKIPGGSKPPQEVFLSAIDTSQIFVQILWKEFSEPVVQEFRRARQAGIPVLIFVKKTIDDWSEKRDQKLQEFIDSLPCTWTPFRGLKELETNLKTVLLTELFRHLKTPCLSISSPELFRLAEDIFSSAKDRIVLLARTLMLVVGPRPYLSKTPHEYEKLHYECLLRLVGNAKNGKKPQFFCGYIIPRTRTLLQENPELGKFAKENIINLFDNCHKKNEDSLFSLGTPKIPEWDPAFTFIVGDNRFAIWFKDPTDPGICPCISSEDRTISDALVHIFEGAVEDKSLETLLNELRLDAIQETKTRKSGLSKIFDGLEGKK